MRIVYTQAARRDLREIYAFIADILLVPKTARALTAQIMSEIRSLETFPARYPLYREEPWHSRGVRFLTFKNYLIFYTVEVKTETVTVARILYGGRDINRQLEETIE